MDEEQLKSELQKYFGYPAFKEGQLEPIRSVLAGKHTLATLPTGTGKSLIYQLSGYLLKGIVVIVSPLLSLMEDQVAQLKYMGEKRTASLNSMLQFEERQRLLSNLNQIKFLFLSPEMLQNQVVMNKLKQTPLALFVVDEAHCISQWGLDFRSDYLFLGAARKELGNPLTLALTATATPAVMADIIGSLHIDGNDLNVFEGAVDRTNIYYKVAAVPPEAKNEYLLELLGKYPHPGIIYFSSKAQADAAAFMIRKKTGLRAEAYHADRTNEDRITIQHQFLRDELDVICATSAFGMGINKPNIRYVIHYHMPNSLEEYVQEIGRAGRDGQQSTAVLLYSETDFNFKVKMLQSDFPNDYAIESAVKNKAINPDYGSPTEQTLLLHILRQRLTKEEAKHFISTRHDLKRNLLKSMKGFAETNDCKREYISAYFGKSCLVKPAYCCDSCGNKDPLSEGNRDARNAVPMEGPPHWEKILSDLFLL
nr:RecQ family ATP-dependent DNA helicase [uncultured Trichococcus sp.]